MSSEVEAIAEKIKELSPPDKLRLAAELLEHKKADLAYHLITQVKEELGAALLLRRMGKL
jgi:hypothetical protein